MVVKNVCSTALGFAAIVGTATGAVLGSFPNSIGAKPMTSDRKKPGVAFWATVVVVVVLPLAAYIGAYAWSVEAVTGLWAKVEMRPTYTRLGNSQAWHKFFWPAHWVDRRVRPRFWHEIR